ncbi:MAG: hypothetical protein H6718_11125 [Polyangiaceae bacterium]|nr:hypothetical protein [Myxococcales bacterium]MCB9585941.1 hypothetical protein [Polyangiaceae bacterium]
MPNSTARPPATRWAGWWLAASLTLLGCSISPQPEPPAEATPGFQQSLITIETTADGLRVAGTPGAVTGTAAQLRIYNLETADTRADAPVADDGSFSIDLPGIAGDDLRLQARSDLGISEPLDITGVGVAQNVVTPLGDCLTIKPRAEVDFGAVSISDFDVHEVEMVNECAQDVSLYGLGQLMGSPGFSFIVSADLTIPQGASRSFGIAFAPGRQGEHEDVVILSFENDTERRPITMRGNGIP